MRYYDPANPNVNLFVEAGDSTYRDPVHQGPYLKYQVRGEGKAGAIRVPLAETRTLGAALLEPPLTRYGSGASRR